MFLAELQNGTGLTDISCVRMIWAKFLGVMFETYILKADVLNVRTPQKIQIFRREFKFSAERLSENAKTISLSPWKANNSAMCYK